MKHKIQYFVILLIILAVNAHSKPFEFYEVGRSIGINHCAFDPLIMGGGVTVIDYNNDGYEDLFVTSGLIKNHFYRNNKNGTFTDIIDSLVGLASLRGKPCYGSTAGDINNDGYDDLFVSTGANQVDFLFLNNGDGTFTDISASSGITLKTYATSATMVDINKDGLLDIYVGVFGPSPGDPCFANVLYVNQGDNKFINKAVEYKVDNNGCALAIAFSDYDNDGDKDLLIGNDFGYFYGQNKLLENEYPLASFKDVSDEVGFDLKINSMGVISGDYDADGDYDYFITNIDSNALYRNEGNRKLKNIAKEKGLVIGSVPQIDPNLNVTATSWGGSFTDFNHDMLTDLTITSGHVISPEAVLDYDRFYINEGSGNLRDISEEVNFYSADRNRGYATLDFDNDGDMDIFVATVHITASSPYRSKFYVNQLQKTDKTNWLKVKLVGTRTVRSAYGSVVAVYVGGQKILRELHGGGDTYLSKNTSILHFGLSNNTKVDSVKVFWLDGTTKVLRNINTNQQITIIQDVDATVNVNLCLGEEYEGVKYSKSQTFYKKYISRTGGDSIVALNIIVNQPSSYIRDISLCDNDLYEDEVITKDTTITKILKNYVGCDSLVTINIKVDEVYRRTENIELCYGALFNGKPCFKDEIIETRIKNQGRCDSIITTDIKVLESPKFEENITLCYGDIYNEKQLFNDTTIVKTFISSLGCDSVYTLFIKVLPEYKSSENISLNSGENYNGIVINNDTTIVNIFKSVNGCDSTHTVNITVTTSVEDVMNFANRYLEIYPNPNKGIFTFELKLNNNIDSKIVKLIRNAKKISIKITDLNSRVVFYENILNFLQDNYIKQIDISNINLSNGTYFIDIMADDINISKKFILDK